MPVEVPVLLQAEGNENALGFSLSFDPTQLAYSKLSTGTDAIGASFNVNALHAGQVGVALALPAGTTFKAGTIEIARVSFVPVSKVRGKFTVGFSSAPVLPSLSDSLAEELPSQYVPGAVNLQVPPSLHITIAGNDILLAWPGWASGFNLQARDPTLLGTGGWTNLATSLAIDGDTLAGKVPLRSQPQLFRLRHP